MGACSSSDQPRASKPGGWRKREKTGKAVGFLHQGLHLPQEAKSHDGGAVCRTRTNATTIAETPSHFSDPIAEQANEIVAHLWPRLSAYASDVMVSELQPAILAALPSALKAARVKFDKERNHLGNNPVEFRSIRFDQETQHTVDGPVDNLVMTLRVEWHADLSVYLGLAGTGVGLNGLSLKGVLVVKLVRMLDQPPFYEGVRVFFNNLPDVDLKFQGAASTALNLGFIRRQIADTITSKLSDLVVVPNTFGFALVPGADIFRIMSPAAQGILHLTVWGADGLVAKDKDWFGRGSSDPYVKIACGAYRFQSPTVHKTLSPTFQFTVSVPISDVERQRVLIELFDEDFMSRDDFLGKLSVPVSKLVKSTSAWERPLLDERGEKGENGNIKISATWHPLTLEQDAADFDQPGMVFAGVYAATKLPPPKNAASAEKYWVRVVCEGLMEGASKGPRETDRCAGTQQDVDTLPDSSEVSDMKEKLEVLRRHNLSKDDILTVLGIQAEPPQLDSLVPPVGRSSSSQMALDLIRSTKNYATVEWNRSFEFPVSGARGASLSFDLMCQSGSSAPRRLGTYQCGVEQVASSPWCTSVRTVTVPGTSALLKLKLQMSFFGSPSSREANGPLGGA